MQVHYDTAVLGATFLGIGVALGSKNCVIIERGGLLGAEFVNSYKVCHWGNAEVQTDLGNTFYEDMIKRRLLSEQGDVYSAPAAYIVSSYLKKQPVDIMLRTEVVQIQKQDGGFCITLYHTGGFESIFVKRIIDTTAQGIGHESGSIHALKKTLNSIIFNPEENTMEGLSFNCLSGLYTFSLPVTNEIERHSAVEQLYEMRNSFQDRHMNILKIASDFAFMMPPCSKVIAEGFLWKPSVGYLNPVEAFDAGVQLGGVSKEELL